jgi:hypothetical protein
MKRAVVAAAVLLAIGTGWASLAQVPGQGSQDTAMPGEIAQPVPAPRSASAETDAAPAARPAGEAPAPASVTPPAPVPDVSIPPIPEVDKEPFKPGQAPVRKPKPDFLEEGKRLFNREGRMEMDAIGRPMFVFDSGDKPMRILENSWREYIETRTDRGKKKAHWRISGVVMLYEGANYLLLTKVVHLMPEEENL